MKKNKETLVDTKKVMQDIQDFIANHPGFLFIVGNPIRDELLVGFNQKFSFVKFPEPIDISEGVVAGVLLDSKFDQAMGQLITGIAKGMDIKGGNNYAMSNLIDKVGGSLIAINTNRTNGKKD